MKNLSLIPLTVILCASSAGAATIITPNTPTTNVAANAGSSLAGLVNGAQLSSSVSTGDDTATALTVTHSNVGLVNNYVSPASVPDYYGGGTVPVLTFALGASYDNIDSIILWNYAQGTGAGNAQNNALQTFSLEFFSDAGATTSIGTVTGLTAARSNPADGGSAQPQDAQQIFFTGGVDFDGVQSIQMTMTDNYFGVAGGQGGDRVGIAEVRFSAAAVPEPSSTALLGLGGLALILRRKK